MNITENPISNNFAFITNQIIEVLFQLREETKKGELLEYLKIDIKLLKEENEYSIQISNCGKWEMEHYNKILTIMNQVCGKAFLKFENKIMFESIGTTKTENCLEPYNEMLSVNEEFSKFEEILSFKLEPKLNFANLEEFKNSVLAKIHELKDLYSNVKFVFSQDSKCLFNNEEEFNKDFKTCSLVSLALMNIVKQSQREEFRRKCFDLFGVNDYDDLDYSIKTKLLSHLYNKKD